MTHYALIFRATRTTYSEELKQRAVEIPAWVKRVETWSHARSEELRQRRQRASP